MKAKGKIHVVHVNKIFAITRYVDAREPVNRYASSALQTASV